MKLEYIIMCFILVFVLFSCKKEKEVQYYADGSVKLEVDLEDGNRHGLLSEYYDNDSLKSRATWKHGVVDGKVEHFYPNGQLKELTYWKKGKAEGLTEEYYENGQLFKKGLKLNNKNVGEINFYHKNGKRKERHIYNESGEFVYLAGFDEKGTKYAESVMPIFTPNKDTISYDESYEVKVKFGLKLIGKVQLIIGVFDKENNLIDTTAVLDRSKDDTFEYSTKSNHQGQNVLSILVNHIKDSRDTISVDGLIVKHSYYVWPQ